jgi:hypothetical protein
VDDLKGVAEDAHSHELLAAVAAVLHERVDKALNNGALRREKKCRGRREVSMCARLDWRRLGFSSASVSQCKAALCAPLLQVSQKTAAQRQAPHKRQNQPAN